MPYYSEKWLDDVTLGPSDISRITHDSINYRGKDLSLCVGNSFEDVAYELLNASKFNYDRQRFAAALATERVLPEVVREFVEARATHARYGYQAIDILRTAVSYLAEHDHYAEQKDGYSNISKSIRLIAQISTIVAQIARHRHFNITSSPRVVQTPSVSHVASFVQMATGRPPTRTTQQIMNLMFVIYAEHGFAASTFAARLAASTGADIYAAVTASIAVLKGKAHGGANRDSMELLMRMHRSSTHDEHTDWATIRVRIDKQLDTYTGGGKVPGFGNPIHPIEDPRVALFKEHMVESRNGGDYEVWEHPDLLGALVDPADRIDYFRIASEVEDRMRSFNGHVLHPNIDFPTGVVLHALKFHPDIYPCIFAASRVVGWCAHYLEHFERHPLIRPGQWYSDQQSIYVQVRPEVITSPDVHARFVREIEPPTAV